MKNEFGKWRVVYFGDPSYTEPNMVYFTRGKGSCKVIPGKNVDIEPYRRLIASAPDLQELLIAALPALQEMQDRTPEHLENLAGVLIVGRVKAALSFIDGINTENDKS